MMKLDKIQRGLSLIELLVAMTIALVAVAAGLSLYVGTRQTTRVQEMQSRLAEDGRFAVFMLQRIIGQAGFRPNPAIVMPANYITPTSVSSVTVRFDGDNANTIGCDGAVVNGAQVLTIASNGSSLRCGNGVATIDWVAPAASGAGNGSELVDFALAYGTDTGPAPTSTEIGCGTVSGTGLSRDCVADTYVLATAQANSSQIVAVKACIVLRSEVTHGSIDKAATVPNCAGMAIAGSQTDQRLYRTFRTTILVRNR